MPLEAKEKPTGSIDSYLRSANSWLAEKKDIAERLLKNTSARTENVKGFFGGLETKLKGPAARKSQWVPPGRAGGPGRCRDTQSWGCSGHGEGVWGMVPWVFTLGTGHLVVWEPRSLTGMGVGGFRGWWHRFWGLLRGRGAGLCSSGSFSRGLTLVSVPQRG